MTKQQCSTILQNIEVIKAWVEGKQIQYQLISPVDAWSDLGDSRPDFSNPQWKWRIKPEPKCYWIVNHPSWDRPSTFDNETDAGLYRIGWSKLDPHPTLEKVQVVE